MKTGGLRGAAPFSSQKDAEVGGCRLTEQFLAPLLHLLLLDQIDLLWDIADVEPTDAFIQESICQGHAQMLAEGGGGGHWAKRGLYSPEQKRDLQQTQVWDISSRTAAGSGTSWRTGRGRSASGRDCAMRAGSGVGPTEPGIYEQLHLRRAKSVGGDLLA